MSESANNNLDNTKVKEEKLKLLQSRLRNGKSYSNKIESSYKNMI